LREFVPDSKPLKVVVEFCSEHCEEESKLYCETCEELVCVQCVVKGGKHHDHDCAALRKAVHRYKEETASLLEPMEKQVTTIKKSLKQLDIRCGEISDQQAVTKDNMHTAFSRLRTALDTRETELVSHLDKIAQEKLKSLAAQRDQMETTLAQLNSCLHFMRGSLESDHEGDVSMIKTNTARRAKELTVPFQRYFLEPNTKADIAFSTPAGVVAVCQKYGYVCSRGSPDTSKCRIMTTAKDLATAVVGEKSTVILQAINCESRPCEESLESLECVFVSEITGTRTSCLVGRRGQSLYEISYQPIIKGEHQLHIQVQGQHVQESPLNVAVKSPVEKLSFPILAIGGVDVPRGIAVNQRGELLVTELGRDSVSTFIPSGEKLSLLGSHGSSRGKFIGPHGVAMDGEGNILVTDCNNHRIQKFTAEGKFLTAVGTKGNGPLQFYYPRDIAFNPCTKKVYTVDQGNDRVQVLNSDLTCSSTFGKRGSGKGQFNQPWGVACDSSGRVYVADGGNHRIQVFTAEGKFLRMFGRRGQCSGELDWPSYISIDSDDMLYVSDSGNWRVSVFTSTGCHVTSFGEGLGSPSGVAVDSSGVVYVGYSSPHSCVAVF
jgi:DNA-binding beta-propeller fold protein YncE